MPMTNFPGRPVFRLVESATTAAITAPTKPSPTTTHTIGPNQPGTGSVGTLRQGFLEGSNVEIMLAYGVVDSIILNCPEVSAVQVLFGGREIATLTGHLDLSKPLALNKRFIAQS